MFDSIFESNNTSTLDTTKSKQIYMKIQVLDSRVTEMIDEGFKNKNKDKDNRKNTFNPYNHLKTNCLI